MKNESPKKNEHAKILSEEKEAKKPKSLMAIAAKSGR